MKFSLKTIGDHVVHFLQSKIILCASHVKNSCKKSTKLVLVDKTYSS